MRVTADRFRQLLESHPEPPSPPIRNFVVAGTAQQFKDWCREHDIRPGDRERVLYVTEGRQLNGLVIEPNDEVHFIGTWYQLRDSRDIDHLIETRRRPS